MTGEKFNTFLNIILVIVIIMIIGAIGFIGYDYFFTILLFYLQI